MLLAKSVYQHGTADLCLAAVNSHCGSEAIEACSQILTTSVAFVTMTTVTLFYFIYLFYFMQQNGEPCIGQHEIKLKYKSLREYIFIVYETLAWIIIGS